MIKIFATMVISTRVSDQLYLHLQYLAKRKGVNISDYVKNALVKYSGFKDSNIPPAVLKPTEFDHNASGTTPSRKRG